MADTGDGLLSLELDLGAPPARLALRLRLRTVDFVVGAATAVVTVAVVMRGREARLDARYRRRVAPPAPAVADELAN